MSDSLSESLSDQPSDQPAWLIAEPYTDVDHGVVKSGKEAQVNLVERIGDDGRSCLIVRKRYLPRHVTQKGQLEAMGVQRVSTFRHDVQYREGRQFRKSRDRRAIERMSTYGKKLLQDRWTGTEHDVMSGLWRAGVSVPYRSCSPTTCSTWSTSGRGRWRRRSCPPHACRGLSSRTHSTSFSPGCARSPPPGSPTAISPRTTCSGGRTDCGSSTSRSRSISPRTCRDSSSSTAMCSTSVAGSRPRRRCRRRGGVRRPAQLPVTPNIQR